MRKRNLGDSIFANRKIAVFNLSSSKGALKLYP